MSRHSRHDRFQCGARKAIRSRQKRGQQAMPERVTQPKADLLQGTLDMLVLRALSLGPLHGYGIVQRIRQLSDDLLTVEQGSLYPALYRMEQRGWIKSKWGTTETGRKAKFYRLSNAGSKQLTREEESWDTLSLAIAK